MPSPSWEPENLNLLRSEIIRPALNANHIMKNRRVANSAYQPPQVWTGVSRICYVLWLYLMSTGLPKDNIVDVEEK
jgi:hypothetical protein